MNPNRIWLEHQRSAASSCLGLEKLKRLVPCSIEDPLTGFKSTIVRVVFAPARIDEVNKELVATGYIIRKGFGAIAVNRDDSILVWAFNLANSVHHLNKWQEIDGPSDKVAFQDIRDLFAALKIKNKKAEVDAMLSRLKSTLGGTPATPS